MRRFPGSRTFAFSIFDDTDHSTVENIRPVYRLLTELGVRITKSVWPLAAVSGAPIAGSTLQEKAYLDFVLWLQSEGFEVGLHNVRNHDAERQVIEKGFEEFHALLGRFPRIHCNHSSNRENIYWGSTRLTSPMVRFGYNLATRFTRKNYFQGHVESSPYFWGDICSRHISYVRNFVFDEINLDRVNPGMPYHDRTKPFVRFWFSSSEGGNAESFCKMICEANQDQLQAEGGVCVMYTHFGNGFVQGGSVRPDFERLIRRLAKMNGWFVPVSTLLDHLRENKAGSDISATELARMERRWFFSKLLKGST